MKMKNKFLKTIFKPASVKADVKRSHFLQLLLGLVAIVLSMWWAITSLLVGI